MLTIKERAVTGTLRFLKLLNIKHIETKETMRE